MTLLGSIMGLPVHAQTESTPAAQTPSSQSDVVSQLPRMIGADQAPDLSMPKTVMSSVDDLIGAGGVIESSPQNLTLYNLSVMMRLLGGPFPRDELLGPNHETLSSNSSWKVEALTPEGWMPLLSKSSNFTIIGTNSTRTFVERTMNVEAGPYSGTFRIFYAATSKGPLKWDLGFQATTRDG